MNAEEKNSNALTGLVCRLTVSVMDMWTVLRRMMN